MNRIPGLEGAKGKATLGELPFKKPPHIVRRGCQAQRKAED